MDLSIASQYLSAAPGIRMQLSHEEFRAKKVFGSLDGLRALSIVGVVWHHCARSADSFYAQAGAEGVPLFFAISGFLITTLLLRERTRTGTISLKDFYARRSLRIFPLYYAVVLLYAVTVAVMERNAEDAAEFFHNLRYFLTYTSNWFVPLEGRVIFYFSWSLATEEQFYLVWPSVERFLGGRARHLPVLVAALLVVLWGLVLGDVVALPHGELTRTMILSIAPAICMGVMLAHTLDDPRGFRVLGRALALPGISVALLLAVFVAPLLDAPLLVHYALMTLLVGACVVREDHTAAPLLRAAPLASIGKVSYGVYLFHVLVLNLWEVIARALALESRGVIFVGVLLTTWGVALLSFRYFEARFLKLKDRFAR